MGPQFYMCQMAIDVYLTVRECVQGVKLLFSRTQLEKATFFHALASLKFAILDVPRQLCRLTNVKQLIKNISECYSKLKQGICTTRSNKAQMATDFFIAECWVVPNRMWTYLLPNIGPQQVWQFFITLCLLFAIKILTKNTYYPQTIGKGER